MPMQKILSFVAIAFLGTAFTADARADLSVNVVNKSGVDPSQVFIMFWGSPSSGQSDD